jgi:hypothetical protein
VAVGLVIAILLVALLLGLLGFIVKGLLWLVFIAAVLLLAAVVIGWVQRGMRRHDTGG